VGHYKTLGVSSQATQEEIKKAYRNLSKEHHPDVGGNEEIFKSVSEAYSTLSDVEKRRQYDNPNPFDGMSGGMGGFPFGFQRPRQQKPDLNAPKDGHFIGVEVELPLKHYVFGGKFKINLNYHEDCADCGGKGFSTGTECDVCNGEGYVQQVERRPGFMSSATRPCHKCGGLGQVSTNKCETCSGTGNHSVIDKEFIFDIPKGSGIGAKIILSGVGRVGINGGRNGDIGIMITNIKQPVLNKLSPDKVDILKDLLEELDA